MARPAKSDPRATFLNTLRKAANVSAACRVAHIARETAYRWRDEDEQFRQQWEEALEEAVDGLEGEAWRRAKVGCLKPVYQGGEKVGEVREYSDSLLQFLLKGRRSEVFRDRQEVSGPDGGPMRFSVRPDLSGCSDEELALLERILSRTNGAGVEAASGGTVPDPL